MIRSRPDRTRWGALAPLALSLFATSASASPAVRGKPASVVEDAAPAPAAPVAPAPLPAASGRDVPPAAVAAAAESVDAPGRPGSVEIQVRRLSDKLADGFRSRPGGGRYERWAVVPFTELGEEVSKQRLGDVVSALLENSLKSDHRFLCVERLRLVEVVKELQLAQAGLVDDRNAQNVGQLAGADVLVVGSVGLLGDRYVINARVVSVDEAKILASAQATVDAAGLVAISSEAVVLRTREEAIFRSVLLPGWGQMYNRQTEKGGLLMLSTFGLLAGGLTSQLLGGMAERDYAGISRAAPGPCADAPSLGPCVARHRQLADDRYQLARGLFIGAGALYLYNLVDAWVFGYTPTAATQSLYGARLVPTADGVQVVGSF